MSTNNNPATLNLDDIQGMITRGYSKLSNTYYFLLQVSDASKAKEWMKSVIPLIDSANVAQKMDKTLHLAFGHQGLRALGLNEKNLAHFPVPFKEGINTPNRNRLLGDDHENNQPENWLWGKGNDVHILVILHATEEDIVSFTNDQRDAINKSGGLSIIHELDGYLRSDHKEPFGFRDGISQPEIMGSGRSGVQDNIIATGEFLLGHKNEHKRYPYSPLIMEEQGDISLLRDDEAGSGKKDLGYNGTFMVFRQMEQLVDEFWNFMKKHTKDSHGNIDKEAAKKLAAKCVGRWPNGASLVNYPDEEPQPKTDIDNPNIPEDHSGLFNNDNFGYAEKDKEGLRCPYGSHLRRNNPRDTFRDYNPKQSLKISKRHRIIRRGRTYELPLVEGSDKKEIGLQFICFNANLELQFEFIQHAWANNNQLDHLTNDIDMVIGVPAQHNPNNNQLRFTVQKLPVNEFVDDWTQFVVIKGGAYYFFPSISAVKYLTTI